ncbi:MAG: MBL fold metallo-hydrolase, partial [Deltaproteobacteria bacterium]
TFEVFPVETGHFRLDGGAMFGVVPRVLWEKDHVPDEQNRIELALRVLLLVDEPHRILIDTGIGKKWDARKTRMFGIDHGEIDLERSLRNLGVSPEDITDVILTHLHFDHAGGATKVVDGRVVPTFPNARYFVQRAHWEHALHPTEKDRASFIRDDFLPLEAAGSLVLLDGTEGFPFAGAIDLIRSDGHTTALQLPRISDGEMTLVYCADLIPTRSHVRIPWVMGFDLRPLETIAEKKAILSQAAQEKWMLFLEHEPRPHAAIVAVTRDEKGGFAATPWRSFLLFSKEGGDNDR